MENAKNLSQNVTAGGVNCASRPNGKDALREAITRIREKADNYEALLTSLPDEMSVSADEGLWLLAISIQR